VGALRARRALASATALDAVTKDILFASIADEVMPVLDKELKRPFRVS
jgi:hypothetical protein